MTVVLGDEVIKGTWGALKWCLELGDIEWMKLHYQDEKSREIWKNFPAGTLDWEEKKHTDWEKKYANTLWDISQRIKELVTARLIRDKDIDKPGNIPPATYIHKIVKILDSDGSIIKKIKTKIDKQWIWLGEVIIYESLKKISRKIWEALKQKVKPEDIEWMKLHSRDRESREAWRDFPKEPINPGGEKNTDWERKYADSFDDLSLRIKNILFAKIMIENTVDAPEKITPGMYIQKLAKLLAKDVDISIIKSVAKLMGMTIEKEAEKNPK